MLPREYISKFCAVSDPRLWLMRPARGFGQLYASDGHIMIQTDDDDPDVSAMENSPLIGAVQRLMAQQTARNNWLPLDMTLPEKLICGRCQGSGQLESCVRCEGTGKVQEDDPAPSGACPDCNGRGEWPDVNGDSCWHCDGSGEGFQAIPVGNTFFQRKYLALLQALPGPVTLSTGELPSTVAFFRFSGGVGALMPCRES